MNEALNLPGRDAVERLLDLVGPLRLRNCPLTPTARQEAFLRLPALEVLYGGAAGGGKTIALLMAALQFSDIPGYDALLVRRSLAEFELPGGLIDLSHDWLAGSKAVWSSEAHCWRFPGPGRSGAGGASLHFGYLDASKDVSRYAGASFSFLGFDELVRFDEQLYRRMFRILRQAGRGSGTHLACAGDGFTLTEVPIRVRATSNPGGPGHSWVKSHFVDPETRQPGVRFLPARLEHNPHLDRAGYAEALAILPGAERARLMSGDWDVPDDGELFQRGWFPLIDRSQLPKTDYAVRYWDLAATEPGPANPDPDFTVGLRLELDRSSGTFYLTDLVRARKSAGQVEQMIAETARSDGREVEIVIEQEPGSSGKAVTDRIKRQLLRGYTVSSKRPSGAKELRARPVAAAANNGLVKIVRAGNTNDLLDELAAFPHGAHDDCVDALAGAHEALSRKGSRSSAQATRKTIYEAAQPTQRVTRRAPNPREKIRQLEHERDETARLAGILGLHSSFPSF